MDIENHLKALLLLRSRLVWISIGVGIVLVSKAIHQADAATQAIAQAIKNPHMAVRVRNGLLIGLTR